MSSNANYKLKLWVNFSFPMPLFFLKNFQVRKSLLYKSQYPLSILTNELSYKIKTLLKKKNQLILAFEFI